jgi:hypothetical protein
MGLETGHPLSRPRAAPPERIITLTTRPSWDERRTHLASWIEKNGRQPSQLSTDKEERSLYSWLGAQRQKLRNGGLSAEQAEALTGLSPSPYKPITVRVADLEAFHAEHGRLPSESTTADNCELQLASYLIHRLRPMYRNGQLTPEMVERLRLVPGTLDIRRVEDQDDVLQELTDYAETTGHLPPLGGSGTPQENRLASWMRNNTRGSAMDKAGRLRERHIAILAIIDKYPTRSEALEEGRLKELADFVAKHGHRPSISPQSGPAERSLAAWFNNHQTSPDPRVAAALKMPSRVDAEWQANFNKLANYAAAHDGRLPGNWNEGRIFSWLTIQRREYRRGKMSPERLEKLLTIDGVIPGKTLLADAA